MGFRRTDKKLHVHVCNIHVAKIKLNNNKIIKFTDLKPHALKVRPLTDIK